MLCIFFLANKFFSDALLPQWQLPSSTTSPFNNFLKLLARFSVPTSSGLSTPMFQLLIELASAKMLLSIANGLPSHCFHHMLTRMTATPKVSTAIFSIQSKANFSLSAFSAPSSWFTVSPSATSMAANLTMLWNSLMLSTVVCALLRKFVHCSKELSNH